MARRQPFNSKKPLVAAREFTFAGEQFKKGDPFPIKDFSLRLIGRQYEARAIDHVDDGAAEGEAPDDQQVTMVAGPQNGRYTITAPWLAAPEVIRGKANADKRFAELTAEGEALKAEAEASPPVINPDVKHPEVLITTDGVIFTVSAPWLELTEEFGEEADAVARQTELREAGPPEGWDPEADASGGADTAGEGGENAAAASDAEDKDEGGEKTPASE